MIYNSLDSGEGCNVWARRIDPLGIPLGSPFKLNQYAAGDQYAQAVSVAPDGRFAAIWQDDRLNQDYADVYCRLFNADGTAAGDEFRVNQVTYGTQAWCYASNMDSQGNFVVSWTDYGRDGFPQAFARMMNFDAGVQGDEFAIEQQPQVLANIHSHTPRLSMSGPSSPRSSCTRRRTTHRAGRATCSGSASRRMATASCKPRPRAMRFDRMRPRPAIRVCGR